MFIPINPWFDSDIALNEAIRLEGSTLVHYFFKTWQEAQEFATRNACQAIRRKWARSFFERYNWTRHNPGARLDGTPAFISGTMKIERPRQYW